MNFARIGSPWFGHNLTKKTRRQKRKLPQWADIAAESLESRQLLSGNPVLDISGLNDEFDDPNSLANWQRVNEVEGWNADQLQQYNINQSQAGRLVMQPHTVVWYQDWRGPMAFKEVTGDFVFTSEIVITDRDDLGGSDGDDIPNEAAFSLGGVMIRTPRNITDPSTDWQPGSGMEDGTNNGENYVFLSLGHGTDGQFSFEVKTTRNSNSQLELTPLGQNINTATLRIARIGNSILTMYQLPGEGWTVHRRYSRPDMPETMQLGLVTYSDWNKAGDFDPFVHNSTVLEPGVADPTPGEAFNPDLVAGFEYARFARPNVPAGLDGVDLVNAASDDELLSFLGDDLGEPQPEPDPGGDNFMTPNISGQLTPVGEVPLVIDLASFNPGNASLSYAATFTNPLAEQVMAEHHLYAVNYLENYALNWGGENEKWLMGDDGWYFLLPDGSLNHWNGSFNSSTQVANLSQEAYADPELLLNGEPFGLQVAIVDNQLVITPGDQVGEFSIELQITDGVTTNQTAFDLAVTNSVPTVIIPDQSVVTGQPLMIELPLEDADGHAITYGVEVTGDPLGALDAEHGFWAENGEYYDNYLGQNERWIRDQNYHWHYLLENGDLFRWEGSFENSVLLAELGSAVYEDPSLLTDPQPLPVSTTIEDGVLTIIAEDGFVGEVTIQITSFDGFETSLTKFQLIIGDDETLETNALDNVFSDWGSTD